MPIPPADSGMSDLFGEPELPAGFRYMPEVLSPAEENRLVQRLEKLPLKPFEFRDYLGNRRIYSFGHRYIFAGQEPRADASIPDYLRPLTDIASRISGTPADAFEQLMVTEPIEGAASTLVHPDQLGGTRHLSAAQFVQDQREAVALVASQDGRFTIFAWSECEAKVYAHRVDALLL